MTKSENQEKMTSKNPHKSFNKKNMLLTKQDVHNDFKIHYHTVSEVIRISRTLVRIEPKLKEGTKYDTS